MPFMDTEKISRKVRLDKELDLFTRGPGDTGVVKEQRQCYRLMLEHDFGGGPMLDVGGHIGAFAQFIRGNPTVGHIHSVEPDPNNIRVFKKNLGRLGDCKLVEGAVVPTVDVALSGTTTLYLGKNYPSCNSLEPFRGRQEVEVPTVAWEPLLHMGQDWTGIKCDIEGGEYLLDWSNVPKHVTMIAMEYHFQREHWATLFRKIDKQLRGQGFKALKKPKVNTFQKVTVGIYAR